MINRKEESFTSSFQPDLTGPSHLLPNFGLSHLTIRERDLVDAFRPDGLLQDDVVGTVAEVRSIDLP
jgi:hypothetical protein